MAGNVCVYVFAFVMLNTSVRSVYCSLSTSVFNVIVSSSCSCFVKVLFSQYFTIGCRIFFHTSGKKISTASSSDSGLSDGEGSSGEEQKRMPVKKIFSNQQALRKRIDDLNGMLKTMEQQRSELQVVLQIIKDWSEDLRTVNRTNLGVPYIRAVKQLLGT